MNVIHPSAVIADGVELGDGNTVGPNVVLLGPLVIGDGNWFGPGVTIGTPPEVRGVPHTAAWDEVAPDAPGIRIGSRNVFREQTLVHQGWHETTRIGDDCFVMNKVYIAHDSEIGDRVTLASTVTMGGHVHVGDGANIGLGTVVHQRRVVGPGAMVGMGSVVTKDVPPFAKVYGNPARLRGANTVGMQRSGVDGDAVRQLADAYLAGRVPSDGEVGTALAEHFLWWSKETSA
jgi:UDP-N-acetylglucosamine acyltransferase